jgi:hypothetical protein
MCSSHQILLNYILGRTCILQANTTLFMYQKYLFLYFELNSIGNMSRSYTKISIGRVFPWLTDKSRPNAPTDAMSALRRTRQKIAVTTTYRKSNKNSLERQASAYWQSRKKIPYTTSRAEKFRQEAESRRYLRRGISQKSWPTIDFSLVGTNELENSVSQRVPEEEPIK